ncbi:lipopolysaccharide biosynthesis protein [Pararhizobium antarcticum]|uniref:Lipopolysaccharide biosynthesis protein n=1 Tax=Pararhizobium antarcticum TaxID=1798805 RepID=A0A657LV05_9HYPH|nr:lipopolysaccharide biosynthesis protein [Pararhizobium antarcticum]OJF95291.1 hypothetical protein AX760_19695 [Pararhizobium antarcticum]OJF96345.1 hypothetical protein AX761_15840 [Rhizobium sp. 58]
MDKKISLHHDAAHGVKWSIIQNWGGKVFTFLLSIVLARLLSPEDFGTASAVALILLLVPMIAEFGFGDAIMQRRDLKPSDINLPFLISIGVVVVMFVCVILMADRLSVKLDIPGQSIYIVVASGVLLFTAPSMFQEAMYKRHMKFKSLALRTFLANIAGGVAAIACAFAGFGIWSFVVQSYVAGLISVAWLWWRPEWKPSLTMDGRAFFQMTRFGMPVVFQRLVDFAGTKTIDIIIVSQFGLAAYGLYAIGSRIYLTMMQLLQGALYDVSLTVLSKISSDRERMAQAYLKTIGLAATFITPVFVVVAALAPEVTDVLLGDKWTGVEGVVAPLMLLGALQCVQFINGPFISARGRPEFILIAGITKSISAITALLLIPSSDVQSMTIVFVLSMLAATPVTFYFAVRELGLTIASVLKELWPAVANGAAGFFIVQLARPYLGSFQLSSFWQGMALGTLFALAWFVLLAILAPRRLKAMISKISRRRPDKQF